MLDLVPLARPGWVVAYGDRDARFIRQLLQVVFPTTTAAPVASTGVGTDQQALGLGIVMAPNEFPPPSNARYSKLGCLVRYTDVHKAFVSLRIIGPVRNCCAGGQIAKVLAQHLLGLPLRKPGFSRVFELSDLLLLLGVHGYDRVATGDKLSDLVIDIEKLPVPLWRRQPLFVLAVGLHGVAELVELVPHGSVTDGVSLPVKVIRDRARGLVGPTQRAHRIARRALAHDLLEGNHQLGVMLLQALATATNSANALLWRQIVFLEFSDPAEYSRPRNAGKLLHGCNSTPPQRERLARHVPASLGFIQPSENREEELVGHVHVLDIGQNVPGTLEENGTLIFFQSLKSGRTCDRKGLLAYSVFVVVLLCSTSCSVPGPPCCDWSEIQVASEIDNRRVCDVLNPRPFCSKHPLQCNCSQACLCWK